jgi:GR25 family glycosyltransferase involved in LPS biosynthesis
MKNNKIHIKNSENNNYIINNNINFNQILSNKIFNLDKDIIFIKNILCKINCELKNERENIPKEKIYKKFNFINHIVWINLNRSTKRKVHMENLLNNLTVPNTRIEAIDGKNENLSKYKNKHPLSNYEIACVLSHIKAINYCANIEDGEYFLILEDDINFNHIQYFTKTVEDIIKEAPPFDVLQIGKVQEKSTSGENTYTKYHRIWGAHAYIITKNAVSKFKEFASYDPEHNEFILNKPLHVSELFIFNNLNTITYKYNLINTLDNESSIHNEHIMWHKKCSLIGLYDIFVNLGNI